MALELFTGTSAPASRRRAVRSLRIVLVCCAWALVWNPASARAGCHSQVLEVLPTEPTVADEITVRWTGVCPTVDGPVPASWSRAGSLIRLDTSVVVGGVPAPDVPYELLTDLGRLPSGSYRVELFLEVFVAPSLPAPEVPDAVLEFEVAGLAAVPTLDPRLLAFLAMLLAAVAVTFLRRL